MEEYERIECPVLAAFGMDSNIFVLSMLLPELIKSAEIVNVPGADHIGVFAKPHTREAIVACIGRVEAERSLREVPVSSNGIGGHHQ
jgi:hypothetical protein